MTAIMRVDYENKQTGKDAPDLAASWHGIRWMNRGVFAVVSAFHFFYCRDSLCAWGAWATQTFFNFPGSQLPGLL